MSAPECPTLDILQKEETDSRHNFPHLLKNPGTFIKNKPNSNVVRIQKVINFFFFFPSVFKFKISLAFNLTLPVSVVSTKRGSFSILTQPGRVIFIFFCIYH